MPICENYGHVFMNTADSTGQMSAL